MFWRVVGDAVAVAVKVQPRARQPGLHGSVPDMAGERLAIGVRGPAEDGRANRAACAALAAGGASRRKMLRISGDAVAIATRLAAL
jgi:uncharacterized protein YggU (UPF0235/DUF167 family)